MAAASRVFYYYVLSMSALILVSLYLSISSSTNLSTSMIESMPRIKISETECSKIADKEAVRIMCLHELFERIDNLDNKHSTIYQMP